MQPHPRRKTVIVFIESSDRKTVDGLWLYPGFEGRCREPHDILALQQHIQLAL